MPLRRYEKHFLALWVGQVREFWLDNRLTQEKLAEALHLTARSYQKLERGVHQPSATTLALFLGQLTDQEARAFIRTFAQLVEATRSQEAPTRLRPHPASPKKSPTPIGHNAGEENALVNCPCYARPPTSSPSPLDNQDGFL